MWDILEENIFDEAVHIDKSQILFNALTKKGQLITVCLRAMTDQLDEYMTGVLFWDNISKKSRT